MDIYNLIASSPAAAKQIPTMASSADYLGLLRLGIAITLETALTYMLVAALFYLILFGVKAPFIRNRKIQKRKTPWLQIKREIGWSSVAFLVFGGVGLFCVVSREMGWSREYQNVDQYGWAYLALSVWLIYTVHDVWHYFWHRMLHEVPFLFRRVHRVHHTFRTPTAFAADAFHPLDALVNISFLPLIVYLFPVHTTVMHLYLANVVVLNIVGHTGFELMPKGLTRHWLFQWLNTPTAHDIHHSHVHCNYGLYTNILDRLLGTFHSSTFTTFERVTSGNATETHPAQVMASSKFDAVGGS